METAADSRPSVQEKSVNRPARLTVTGVQTDGEGNVQEYTAVYQAVLISAEKGYTYHCYGSEDEMELFLSRTQVSMTRGGSGGKETKMIFDPSVPVTGCDYSTPFGIIPMRIRTRNIVLLPGGARNERVRARLKYTLTMEPAHEVDCVVTIKVQP